MIEETENTEMGEIEKFGNGCSDILLQHFKKISEEDGESEFRKRFDKAWDEVFGKKNPKQVS
jgi:hypothetical protein